MKILFGICKKKNSFLKLPFIALFGDPYLLICLFCNIDNQVLQKVKKKKKNLTIEFDLTSNLK